MRHMGALRSVAVLRQLSTSATCCQRTAQIGFHRQRKHNTPLSSKLFVRSLASSSRPNPDIPKEPVVETVSAEGEEAGSYDEATAAQVLGIPSGVSVAQAFQRPRYVRPAMFAILLSSGIFVGLSFLQAREDLKPKPLLPQFQFRPQNTAPGPLEVASRYYATMDQTSRLNAGLIVTLGAVHVASKVAYRAWYAAWHVPARNVNWTLFSSMFVHSGMAHLFFNTYALFTFGNHVGRSKIFESNPYHMSAFFLATGVLSGYAQHLSTIFQNPAKLLQNGKYPTTLVRFGGASGALFGILSIFCTQYPDLGVGIIFLPFYMKAQDALTLAMAFDLYGLMFGIPWLPLGHAAHLGGALVGIGYCYFDGKNAVWSPLVNFWKRQIRNARS